MRYGSDLDLVFLYGEDGESTTGVDHREWFSRASQRFISRWRRCSRRGGSTRSTPACARRASRGCWSRRGRAFERYHRDEAAGWERVALLRARIVTATKSRRCARSGTRRCSGSPSTARFERGRFVADLRRVRARVETERGRVPRRLAAPALRSGRHHGRRVPGRARPAPRTRPTRRCGRRHRDARWRAWSRTAGRTSLADDYATLRRVALRLRLLLDRPEDVVSPRDLPILARSLGTTAEALAAELDDAWRASARCSTDVSPSAYRARDVRVARLVRDYVHVSHARHPRVARGRLSRGLPLRVSAAMPCRRSFSHRFLREIPRISAAFIFLPLAWARARSRYSCSNSFSAALSDRRLRAGRAARAVERCR